MAVNFGRRHSECKRAKEWSIDECESKSKGVWKFVKENALRPLKKLCESGNRIEETDKSIIACMLWELILPSLNYDYIVEESFIPFLNSLKSAEQFDYAIKSLMSYCLPDELSQLFSRLFHLLAESSLHYCYINDRLCRNTALPLILRLVAHQLLLGAWLCSKSFFEDLELLYFTHLPSKSDLERELPAMYYADEVFIESDKEAFYKRMEKFSAICNKNEEYLIALTKVLLSDTAIYCSDGTKLIPRTAMISFLDSLIRKNIGYTQEFVGNRSELTRPSAITNIVFSLLHYLELPVLSAHPKHFPFSLLCSSESAPELLKLDRMGGLLSYLNTVHDKSKFKVLSTTPANLANIFYFALFNRATILYSYAGEMEVHEAVKGVEKCLHLRYTQETLLEEYKENVELQVKDGFMAAIPYQHYVFTPTNVKVLFASQISSCTKRPSTSWKSATTLIRCVRIYSTSYPTTTTGWHSA